MVAIAVRASLAILEPDKDPLASPFRPLPSRTIPHALVVPPRRPHRTSTKRSVLLSSLSTLSLRPTTSVSRSSSYLELHSVSLVERDKLFRNFLASKIFFLFFSFWKFRNCNAKILWNVWNIVVFARKFSTWVPFFFFFLKTSDWAVCKIFDETVYNEIIRTISSKIIC